jgi:hypothetical protein
MHFQRKHDFNLVSEGHEKYAISKHIMRRSAMHMIPYCRFRSIVCIACMCQISAANKRREGGNVNLLRF